MRWRTHKGEVVFATDLLAINLREPGATPPVRPPVHFHVYDVRYCESAPPGRFAFVRIAGGPGPLELGVTVAELPELGAFFRARFERVGADTDTTAPIQIGEIERTDGADAITVRVRAGAFEIAAEWSGLGLPHLIEGQSPVYTDEYVWSMIREADVGTVSVDGVVAPGEVYPDRRFVPRLGHPVSSCLAGLSEVSLRLRRGNAPD